MGGTSRTASAPAGSEATTSSPQLSVIIVSYNTRRYLRRCLQSLRAFPPRCAYEVLVVDNASTDGSLEMLRDEFAWVHVLANPHNLGYSAAVNQGIDGTRSPFVLVLNPDIVVREGAVDALLAFMETHPDAGICGGQLLNTDGTLQYSCRSFYTPKTLLMRRTPLGRLFPRSRVIRDHLMLDYDHRTPRAVDWVIGACMLVRRAAIEAVGGMDERFFLYFEDVDWCYRMSRQGWKVYYVPESRMVHEHQRDSAKPRLSRSFWAHLGSLLRFYEKWNRYAYWLKRYREILKIAVFAAGDLLAVNLAFLAAYGLRVLFAESFTNPLYTLENYHNFWVFTNIVTFLSLLFTRQYHIERGKPAVDELVDLARALAVAVVIIMASTYIARERLISRAVVVFFFFLALGGIWAVRRMWRAFHRRILEMRVDLRRVAIVGSEDEARELRARLLVRPELGLDVVGAIDAEEASPRSLGRVADLREIVREHRIQEVVVAPSAARAERVARMVLDLQRSAVEVKVVSGFAAILSHRARVDRLAEVPVLRFGRDTLFPLQRVTKRLAEALIAVVALLAGSPCCVVYWLVARMRRMPLFVAETRLGRDACPIDLPQVNPDLGLPPSDLVDLPAWWSILRGRLALVGTYPLPPEYAERLEAWQRVRFDVRPGITGFWRITREDEFDLASVVQLDLYYVQNWSLGLDVRVGLQSLGRMLRGRGLGRRPPQAARKPEGDG